MHLEISSSGSDKMMYPMSLKVTGLFKLSVLSSLILVVCGFWRIVHFFYIVKFMNVMLYVVVPYYLFNVSKIYSGILSFICDIVDLYLLYFYFCQFFLCFTNFMDLPRPPPPTPREAVFCFIDFSSFLILVLLTFALTFIIAFFCLC